MNTLRVRIRSRFALGDTVVLTAAVRDLHQSYPGRFSLCIDSGYPEVWAFNPYVRSDAGYDVQIDCEKVHIDLSGGSRQHYVQAYLDLFNRKLGTQASLSTIAGDIHLSARERSWYSDVWSLCGKEIPFWLICPGGKEDIPIKWWNWQRYQEVVDALRGKIQFVQVGTWGNVHPPLKGVIDLRGKTGIRDLIHLVHNADGVLCGVTSLMHLAAAVPSNDSISRAGVIVAGAREPESWEAYPGHAFLSTEEKVDCPRCWKSTVHSGPERDRCMNLSSELPRCMDLITSDQVIETFLALERSGRARFLRGSDWPRARLAIRNAAARNDFDEHNLHHENAPAKGAVFIEGIADYPANRFSGRGVVICAGGFRYFTQAWVCIRMLRQHGCRLPIEVWHYGRSELDGAMAELLAPLGVRCVNALDTMKRYPMRNPLGYELKCYSVLHSQFEEVLSLDADNVPLCDPAFLFETPQYRETGAIFWPDYKQLNRRDKIWKLCGVPYRPEPEFESGQMVIDKRRCWKALNLAWWYNDHSEFFYRFIHGDKDTFHMAWRRLDQNYSMIPFPIESLEGVMCQHDFEGRRIFQHRNSHKWTFYGQNRRISGFLLEEECLDHLRELRRLWDGRINGREPFRTIGKVRLRLGTCDEAVFRSVAGENEYGLPARFSADDVILDVGTHIGSFTRACWERGSRAIHGFEPHPENFRLARHNLRELPGVALRQAAVLHAAMKVIPGEFPEDLLARNTGGVEVIPHREGTTKGLAMDALLRKLGKVLLVKLDCEGSEWPILLHSLEWPRVRALCGEYHARASHLLCPGLHGPLNARLLRKLLLRHFQFVKITPDHGGGLGKFWASHERGFFPSRT